MPIFDSDELLAAQLHRPDTDFTIKKLYVKDASYEAPNTPRIFETPGWTPDVDLHLHTETARFGSTEYEVALRATVTVTDEERTMYLVEVTVAGLFAITGLTEEEVAPVLGVYCPTILFPYLREVVSDLAVRGGFPQLVLAPVNFQALFRRHREEEALSPSAPGS